ncbi:MAG: hypothetical protein RL105_144, partial [Verrucomicrobiota bacterium]
MKKFAAILAVALCAALSAQTKKADKKTTGYPPVI